MYDDLIELLFIFALVSTLTFLFLLTLSVEASVVLRVILLLVCAITDKRSHSATQTPLKLIEVGSVLIGFCAT
jgi:hypothetical protein